MTVRAGRQRVPPTELPASAGRVVDNANLLSPAAEARLAGLSDSLKQRTTDELFVVTLPTLNDRSIEDVGYSLGNHWGVGEEDKDNGVLLIVAPDERKVRIEVGSGLEPILTDAGAAEIIADILPAFRQSQFERGLTTGAQRIADHLIQNAQAPRIGNC